ncbi:TPA: hypothetical protein ACU6JA_001249 [Salmonella enterica]|uniref:Uncharacterized protein n=1 Tax=Salmonella enterica TaxID=28901 RepID=A0A3F3J9H0_SALER|nr:hypothetical protein [Salmonella enterica]EBP3673413.1 hypothetical protein [Salmonella enterica subsp. enterica]EDW0433081.1 hypothetical protein [Salmonella enterica subsp. enterica serovar Lexington]EEJ6652658.1 hypothetical protein [Salmonella enterica subsp. enterica serovar Redlands]EAA7899947.1 hypothetical protein [Salmonella enterica]EAA9127961.1 hypothetical protein [Salmonella enterica]
MPHACKISEVIELLQQHQHDDFVLCSVWYEDDVRNVDDSVTTEEARAAIHHAASHHDAEQGINWDTLEAALDAIRQ